MKPPLNSQESWRPDEHVCAFQKALDAYEKDHPDWRFEVLFSFVQRALFGLKKQIEDPGNKNVKWDSPFTEFHHPVEWDWDVKDVPSSKLTTGKFTPQNTRDSETTRKTVAEMMVSHLNTLALQDFTNHIWLEKRDDAYVVFLPPEFGDLLQSAKGKRQRQELLEELSHPFSIGAGLVEFGDEELQDGKRISKQTAKRLAKLDKLIAIRKFAFVFDINGRHLEMSLVFQIHPLKIDYAAKSAYHSITVGLFTPPEIIDGNPITKTPSDWPQSDVEILWKELFQGISELIDEFIPKTQSQSSEILLVTAELEIPLASSHPDEKNAAKKKILDALMETSSVRKITIESAGGVNNPTAELTGTASREQSKTVDAARPNPWVSGSFYLFAMVVLLGCLTATAKILNSWILPLIFLGVLLLVITVGVLQLRNDDKIQDKTFLTLMKLVFQKMPLLGKVLSRKRTG